MSLLTIVQKTCDALSLPRPSAVVTSSDPQVRQLYALANEEGEELASSFDWQALRREQTFTTTATAEQTTALPSDLDRFIDNSFFNRTTMRAVMGPVTPQYWQAIQAQPALNRVYLAFAKRAGQFLLTPTPPADETIAYEYISDAWAKSAAGEDQTAFQADDDETYLDERLIRLGVKWRFLQAKGLDYAEAMQTYEQQKELAQARDAGAPAIGVGVDGDDMGVNIPEGSWAT